MAKIFDFCSSKGGTHWWKWCGDGSMYDIGCGGGLFDNILERRDSKLFKMLSPGFWVGYLVKREDI